MDIRFSADDELELQKEVAFSNQVGEVLETVESYLLRRIKHSIIEPARANRRVRETQNRLNRIALLPPAADAELEALILKYTGSIVTTRTR